MRRRGGETMSWTIIQLLPFVLLTILTYIPAARLFQKLGMSRGWALFALWPMAGQMTILWIAGYSRRAGIIFALLVGAPMIAGMIAGYVHSNGAEGLAKERMWIALKTVQCGQHSRRRVAQDDPTDYYATTEHRVGGTFPRVQGAALAHPEISFPHDLPRVGAR
jgi:hypothetical protein